MESVVADSLTILQKTVDELKREREQLLAYIDKLEGRASLADLESRVQFLEAVHADGQLTGQFRIEALRTSPDLAVRRLLGVPSYEQFENFVNGLAFPEKKWSRGRLNRINMVAATLMHVRLGKTYDDLCVMLFSDIANRSWMMKSVASIMSYVR